MVPAFTLPAIRTPVCRSVRETRQLFLTGGSTVAEHLEDVLAAIREIDPTIGAFVAVADDRVRDEADAADQLLSALGAAAFRDRPLLGVPIAIKDLIQTRDLPTRRGSLVPNRRPAVDAPAVARLRAAGAILVGKTATSEHGWSASTVSRVAGPTRNPWAPERTAGGSSGGSAAAVAAGLSTAAIGTDGAGSIRIPAAFCGVVGFKPSFGRVPYVPPGAERLSHLGPLATEVADITTLMAVLVGPDHQDPDSVAGATAPTAAPAALRIGWLDFPGTTDAVRAVTDMVDPALARLGHRVERIAVPFTDPYGALVDLLAAAEAAAATPAAEERLCDPGRLALIRYGRTLTGAAVLRAEETRMALRARLHHVMQRYDLLAMATVPITPFAAEAVAPPATTDPDGLRWLAWSPATYPFNLTGQPALSLPAGVTPHGLPVGVQLVGRVGDDDLVLQAATRLEAELAREMPWPGGNFQGER
ncbi:amidase family protein [Salinispora sp. H7-4]|uniref:amidase n=1 Tax=Salinispora sp. H7-4 TaxID=2748321 RepID=UPI002814F879|nr:amidase family protein [Salinispora sp. H7-4]